ncbi:MAG: AAA family ATPase [Planctomycetota bacterium]
MIVSDASQHPRHHAAPSPFNPIEQTRQSRDALVAELAGQGVKGNNCRCPAREHDDKHPSAGVYQGEDGAWRVKCHSCGFCGDLFDVRAELSGQSVEDVLKAERESHTGATRNGTASTARMTAPAKPSPSPEPALLPVDPVDLETLRPLAQDLGVSSDSLMELGIARHDDCWIIPERDAGGAIIGQQRRYDNGDKKQVKGTKRGLTYKHPFPADEGATHANPVFIVEGASDTAAGLDLRMPIVGRPSATGGVQLLGEMLAGRHVVIVGEHDDGAGQAGAEAVAAQLAGPCASVRIIYPPAEAKDLRSWYAMTGGCDHQTLLDLAGDVEAVESIEPANTGKSKSSRQAPNLLRLSDVEPTTVRWLWPGRVPRGRMTLLVGRPGGGKSFATADFAARVSTGRDWPDGTPCPAGSVLLCSAEDDPADTIAPRLIAHDADRSRIHLMTGVRYQRDDGSETEKVFTLADIDPLRMALEQLDDCRLIVVDPVGSYLGSGADAHRDNEVRGVLAPLCKLAEQYDAALLVVAHTRKSAATHADDMALGSRAFTGLARSVLHLMTDPDDDTDRRRLLLPGKNNLAEQPDGLAFDIGPGEAVDEDGQPRPCIRWHDGTVDITADDAVNRDPADENNRSTERDEAADWLRQALAAGARPAKHIIEEAREGKGIAKRTLDRARKEVGVDAYRPENPGPWWWRLPNAEAQCHTPQGLTGGNLAMCHEGPKNGDFGGDS